MPHALEPCLLLSVVSQRIAADLVLVDDHRNGWRFLVLPIAQQDQLVEDTVLSAAAFHFATNVDDRFLRPNAIYQRAIRNLRTRQDLTSYDMVKNQSILLSLLVLLVAAVVSGSSDFRTIFSLLEACVHALGGEDSISHGELGTFIVWQIHQYVDHCLLWTETNTTGIEDMWPHYSVQNAEYND